ncbi:unnamed protein product, partial [Heterosigma akashiwo]
ADGHHHQGLAAAHPHAEHVQQVQHPRGRRSGRAGVLAVPGVAERAAAAGPEHRAL